MNLFHLKYFLDAAKNSSLTQSAISNRVSHSAVSQAIRALEIELEVKLLVHGKRRFELTEQGQLLFARGHELLMNAENLKTQVREISREPQGTLRVGAPQSLWLDALWKALPQCEKEFPKLKINIRVGASAPVKALIKQGELDLAFALDDQNLEDFETQTVKKGTFVVVASPRLKDSIGQRGLMVTGLDKAEVRTVLEANRKKFAASAEILSWSCLKKLAVERMGYALVPNYVVHDELKSGALKKIVVASLPSYEIKAIWSRGKTLSRKAQAFLDVAVRLL